MMKSERFKPHVTVAAVVCQQERYLLVEEHTTEGLRLNNPAGHLEAGETLLQAVVRETLEETAYDFQPLHLVGVYHWQIHRPLAKEWIPYVRFAFTGNLLHHWSNRSLDDGIERVVWLTLHEIMAQQEKLRSPMVLQCIQDHALGRFYPLSLLCEDESVKHHPVHPLKSTL